MDPVSQRCLALAKELTRSYRHKGPPFSLSDLLPRYGIIEVRERLLPGDGRLLSSPKGFIIEINSLFPRVRRRLTLAHEIGHLILNECTNVGLDFDGHSDSRSESLCNHVAGELLVPDWALEIHFSSAPRFEGWETEVNAKEVLEAAATFEVSVEVMTKRIFHDLKLAPNRIAIIWRYIENRKRDSSGKQLRISAAWHSMGKDLFVPLNKTAPKDSLVSRSFETGDRLHGGEVLDLGSTKRRFVIDAAAFQSFPISGSTQPTRAVLALLTPA
jgi:Zn-dependent peptidase ImmA (M78 family)